MPFLFPITAFWRDNLKHGGMEFNFPIQFWMGFWPQTSGHNSLRWLKNNWTQEFKNVSWHSLRYEPKHTLRHRAMLAVCRGDADALEKCIDEGWDIHATVDRRGRFNTLTLACHLDQLELVHLCDIKGANLSQPFGEEQVTPMMAALGRWNVRIVDYLIERKVDPNVKDKFGFTAG